MKEGKEEKEERGQEEEREERKKKEEVIYVSIIKIPERGHIDYLVQMLIQSDTSYQHNDIAYLFVISWNYFGTYY